MTLKSGLLIDNRRNRLRSRLQCKFINADVNADVTIIDEQPW